MEKEKVEVRGGILESEDFKRKWENFTYITLIRGYLALKILPHKPVSVDVCNTLQIQASTFCVNSTMV